MFQLLFLVFILEAILHQTTAQAQCDVIISDTKPRIITTPNYPDDYDSFRTCNYVIERANRNVCKVQLEIIDFSTEEDDGCNNDYYDLGEGYAGLLTTRRLCGNIISSTKKELRFTNSNTLTTRFRSDGTGSARGFSIKITQIPDSCSNIGTRTDRPPTTSCYHTLQGEFVTITSPNYPQAYPSNQDCTYRVERFDRNVCTAQVNVNIFNLDGSPGQCFGDYFEMPTGEKLCGQQSTTRTITLQRGFNDFTFRFHSNGFDQRNGFRISIQQLRNSCFGSPQTTIPPGKCRVEIRDLSKTITSPGYPSRYPAQVQCTYIIRRYDRNICRVELDVRSFEIASSVGCVNEYLQLDNGERLCGRLSGTRSVEFDRSKDHMTLTFVSSPQATSNKGFQIHISQRTDSCGGLTPPPQTGVCDEVITDKFRTIRSPGFASGRYDNNIRCVYTIRRHDISTCIVEVDFNIQGIEDSFSCLKDSIKLPNGLALCGNNKFVKRQLVFPSGNQNDITIVFATDSYGVGRGFEMTVRQKQGSCSGVVFPTTRFPTYPSVTYPGVTYPGITYPGVTYPGVTYPGVTYPGPPGQSKCGGTYSTETFYIRSPNFQTGYYLNNQDCEYRINKVSNDICALQLTYTKFEIEKSDDCVKDYFEVDGVKNCGTLDYDSVRTYRFTRDTEILKFHSDSERTASGFFVSGKQLKC